MSEKIFISEDEGEKRLPINVKELWTLYLSKKYWFLVSVIVALAIASWHIITTPPTYKRSASILIKGDDKSKSSSLINGLSSFSDLDLLSSNANVYNEVHILKSPALMEDVVRRLCLNEKYTLIDKFYNKDLYGQSPIKLNLDGKSVCEEGAFSFSVRLSTNGDVSLSDFTDNNNILSDITINGRLYEQLRTPLGIISIVPTSFYTIKYNLAKIIVTVHPVSNIASGLCSNLDVDMAEKQSTVISLSLKDISTQRAEDVLNTLLTVYNEAWIKDKNRMANSLSDFIDQRLGKMDGELGTVDNDISSFKSKNLLPDVNVSSQLYMQQASENRTQMLTLDNQLSIARYILSYIGNTKMKDQLLPINTGIQGLNIEMVIKEYNSALLQRNTLLQNSSEKNPVIRDLNESLVSMRQSIVRSLESLIASISTNIDNIKYAELQANSKIASNPSQAKYLMSVERQQKVKESLYIYLLQKKEENELSKAFTAYNIRIVTPPSGNNIPTNMERPKIFLIAIFMGLLIPGVFFFLLKTTNTNVKTRNDLDTLTLPFTGYIPEMEEDENVDWKKKLRLKPLKRVSNKATLVVSDNKVNQINEAFRVVRTNFDFMYSKSPNCKVALFTSLVLGSGKTFVSLNLASSFAIQGKRVLLIDLDMRAATLSTIVNSPKTGISNYLAQQTDDISDILIEKRLHPCLDIIPLGTIPPNPTELLADKRLEELFNKLRDNYDYIFVDATPIHLFADSAIIANVADITVFMIRAGLMDKQMIPDVEGIYQSGVFKNMSIILNGVSNTDSRNYGYSYGYSRK
ncbi:MAG: polysaccharide biosynthesis tyrosine autokinase [Paludibacteraceae bacterium]